MIAYSRLEKNKDIFSERPTQDQRASGPGRVYDWRGSQALYQCATSPYLALRTRRSAQRVALREINVDTLVYTLTRRGRHQRYRLVTLRGEKLEYFFERATQDQRGSSSGCMHDCSQAIYQCATSPS